MTQSTWSALAERRDVVREYRVSGPLVDVPTTEERAAQECAVLRHAFILAGNDGKSTQESIRIAHIALEAFQKTFPR